MDVVAGKDLDTEIPIKYKNRNDWINLTENQKFHAVSNVLYSLSQQGYTTETEYYYISALNEFYSDTTTKITYISVYRCYVWNNVK